jgi:hypothetical protein
MEAAEAEEQAARAQAALDIHMDDNSDLRKQVKWYEKHGARLEAEAATAKAESDAYYTANKVDIDSVGPAMIQNEAAQYRYGEASRAFDSAAKEMQDIATAMASTRNPARKAQLKQALDAKIAEVSQARTYMETAKAQASASSATIGTLDKAAIAKFRQYARISEVARAKVQRVQAGKRWFRAQAGAEVTDWKAADTGAKTILEAEVAVTKARYEKAAARLGTASEASRGAQGRVKAAQAIIKQRDKAKAAKILAESWRDIAVGVGLRYRRGINANRRMTDAAERTLRSTSDRLKPHTLTEGEGAHPLGRKVNVVSLMDDLERDIGRGGIEFLKKQPN